MGSFSRYTDIASDVDSRILNYCEIKLCAKGVYYTLYTTRYSKFGWVFINFDDVCVLVQQDSVFIWLIHEIFVY